MKASEFTTEDNFGTHPKRPARTGSRHPRGHEPVPRYKTITDTDSNETAESVAGPKNCWPGHRKVGTQPGTGKNAGKRVNDCEKIKKEGVAESDGWIGNPAKWKEAVLAAHGPDVVFKNYSHPGQPGKRSVNAWDANNKIVGVYQRHNKMGMVQPNQQGVAEAGYSGIDDTDTVGFSVNSERAYNAVMARFGDQIDHDETSGILYVPARMWPKVEMVAFDADGEGATQADGLDEGSDDLSRVLELSGIGLTEDLDPDQQFDIIEEMVEQLAEQHGVDAEQIWEDFESVDDNELYETAAWRRKEGKSKSGGLNAKGVASYRRENPGSKLQTAVTTKPSKLKPGSKAAKRRKSFCARMGGVKGPMKKPNGKPTRKALALRKWNC